VSASTTDPEGKVTRAELRARIGVYVSRLPPELAQVVRVMDFLGMTVQQAHVALGRPPSTISWQHARAREMLEEMVLASERGPALAAQLRK
jgi:DNA-directed RNA polymerase specialized sigma24 family protein